MHETTIATRTSSLPETPSAAPRPDLYAAVHKGLRAALADALVTMGATDPGDDASWSRAAAKLETTLGMCEKHLHHENVFIETAIAARVARTAPSTGDEHPHHVEHIDALRALSTTISRTHAARRAPLVARLYGELSDFVAENLVHMRREETENNAALWAAYSDDELRAIEHALVSDIPPASMAVFLSWMIPALHHGERVGMLGGMKAGAPPEAFAGVLAIAEDHLDAESFNALRAALG